MDSKINLDIYEGGEEQNYKLLDSGNKRKLEEVNGICIARSEPRAWWKCSLGEGEWKKAVASFGDKAGNTWKFISPGEKEIPREFEININNLKVKVKFLKTSKQIGIFPEQEREWQWMENTIKNSNRNINVLNLFGYTGIASLVAARAGAKVTHVDGSKTSMAWAKENQELSGMKDSSIRWILDDAVAFLKREVKRGVRYDGIIMDPPTFGRGPKGEVWKIEKNLPILLDLCREVLSDKPLFFILNMYATELSALSLKNLMEDTMKGLSGKVEAGELAIKHVSSNRLLPTSIFAKWSVV